MKGAVLEVILNPLPSVIAAFSNFVAEVLHTCIKTTLISTDNLEDNVRQPKPFTTEDNIHGFKSNTWNRGAG